MKCTQCGAEFQDGANFCPACGFNARTGQQPAAPQPQAYQAPPPQQQYAAPPPAYAPPQYQQQYAPPPPPQAYQQPGPNPPQYPVQNQYGAYPLPASAAQPGKTMIRVCGIILTVIGAIGFFAGIGALAANSSSYMPDGWAGLIVYEILMALATIAFGILGIVFAPQRDKATAVMIFGVIIIVLRFIDLLLGIVLFGSAVTASMFSGAIIGSAIPVLYIVGGNMRRNAQN